MLNYTERYTLYCKDLTTDFLPDHVPKHNAAMKKLGKLYHTIKDEPDKSFLLDLLQCDDDMVRSIVAAHCLGLTVYVREARLVLKEISRSNKNSVLAFQAKSTLEVWKTQGYLIF